VNKATKISAQFSAIQQSKKKLNEGRRRLFLFRFWREKKRGKQKKKVKKKRRLFTFFLEGKKKGDFLAVPKQQFCTRKNKNKFLS
jgi:hypothetical protein